MVEVHHHHHATCCRYLAMHTPAQEALPILSHHHANFVSVCCACLKTVF